MACQCPKCGASCPEEAAVCPDCGGNLTAPQEGEPRFGGDNPVKQFDRPMRWYRFLIRIGLLVIIFQDICSCYNCFHYNLIDDHRFFRYSINPLFQIQDWIDGFGFAAAVILGSISWWRLEQFKRNGPLLYLVYRWLSFFLSDIGLIFSSLALDRYADAQRAVGYALPGLIFVLSETVYFKKRKGYFLY